MATRFGRLWYFTLACRVAPTKQITAQLNTKPQGELCAPAVHGNQKNG